MMRSSAHRATLSGARGLGRWSQAPGAPRWGLRGAAPGQRRSYEARTAIPTTGAGELAVDPKKWASPKLKIPPSAATNQ